MQLTCNMLSCGLPIFETLCDFTGFVPIDNLYKFKNKRPHSALLFFVLCPEFNLSKGWNAVLKMEDIAGVRIDCGGRAERLSELP